MTTSTSLKAEKQKLRREMKQLWRLMVPDSEGVPRFLVERLQDNLRWWLSKHPGVWGSYRPLRLEADPGVPPIAGVDFVFPRIVQDRLEFSESTDFAVHRWGMEEPQSGAKPVSLDRLVGVIVPGLAFDPEGGRLGRGAGFYDRSLAGCEVPFRGLRVGLAYDFQMRKSVPSEAHDVRMDVIVTDQTVIECGGIKWKW